MHVDFLLIATLSISTAHAASIESLAAARRPLAINANVFEAFLSTVGSIASWAERDALETKTEVSARSNAVARRRPFATLSSTQFVTRLASTRCQIQVRSDGTLRHALVTVNVVETEINFTALDAEHFPIIHVRRTGQRTASILNRIETSLIVV